MEFARLNEVPQPLSVAAKLTAETFGVLVLPASRGGRADTDDTGMKPVESSTPQSQQGHSTGTLLRDHIRANLGNQPENNGAMLQLYHLATVLPTAKLTPEQWVQVNAYVLQHKQDKHKALDLVHYIHAHEGCAMLQAGSTYILSKSKAKATKPRFMAL